VLQFLIHRIQGSLDPKVSIVPPARYSASANSATFTLRPASMISVRPPFPVQQRVIGGLTSHWTPTHSIFAPLLAVADHRLGVAMLGVRRAIGERCCPFALALQVTFARRSRLLTA